MKVAALISAILSTTLQIEAPYLIGGTVIVVYWSYIILDEEENQ